MLLIRIANDLFPVFLMGIPKIVSKLAFDFKVAHAQNGYLHAEHYDQNHVENKEVLQVVNHVYQHCDYGRKPAENSQEKECFAHAQEDDDNHHGLARLVEGGQERLENNVGDTREEEHLVYAVPEVHVVGCDVVGAKLGSFVEARIDHSTGQDGVVDSLQFLALFLLLWGVMDVVVLVIGAVRGLHIWGVVHVDH
jgi:hypothetical protein